jgi:two-component system, chemotaxis family, sensor kinase CheA
MSTNTNQEILREFLLETHENLALLDSDLITLEKNPTEKNTLAQVFRTLHSVKGTAGFMGLVKLQGVAHSAESLLSKLRAGEIIFNPMIATVMLKVVDAIREVLASIETSGSEGTGDYTALQAEVDRLRETGGGIAPAEPPPAPPSPIIEEMPAATTVIAAPPPPPAPAATESVEPRVPVSVADTNIRVDVGLLDKLMTLVGELVLARNQILQYSTSHEDDAFLGAVQRLNLLTTELQASVMKTRMQPIGNVLNKFPRVVRDLALACGKKVRFEMDGQETELDKTLIEAIRDPLTHMVRNAIDHGIEAPAIRKSHNKPEEGRLRMDAFHEGGKVIIEIADDGGGIDVARVRDKAIHAKLITPESAARMSRQELLRLIFLPGFSTADRVTQFSGRGVGMDVVRTNIEKIGGAVDIESTAGQGTTIRTKIPLTLAIIPALIIVSGGERYAIPQVSLLELVRLDPEQAQKGIERIHGAPVYRLRGALLPLVFLDEQLKLDVTRNPGQDLNIVVLQADDRPFGLVVDTIRDTEEIVVKPLQKQLKGVSVFAGAAIMGDGRVALVLDILGLAQRASVLTGAKGRSLSEQEQPAAPAAADAHALLFFEPREGGQMAIPLSLVARLEEIPKSSLENLGTRQVVQYRGEILPLVDVSQELEALRLGTKSSGERTMTFAKSSEETIPVVVCADANQRVGLMVGKILDIVHDQISARSRANRPGVLFTAIVQDRVTEFVDVAALVREATTDLPQPRT